jgi:hypothetical protein
MASVHESASSSAQSCQYAFITPFFLHAALRCRERVAQRERQHREREHAFAERLKKQQRVADTRGNDDEVRAKRAEEARVLAQRAREAAEAERKAAFMRRVMEEREAQVRLKAVVDAEEKAREEALALEVLRKDAEQALAIRVSVLGRCRRAVGACRLNDFERVLSCAGLA